jgi:general secretion pathway protein L
LSDRLGRLHARLQPGAGGFFAWWGRSLAAWLPARWRAALGLGRDRLLLGQDADALQVRLETSDAVHGTVIRDLGRVPATGDQAFDTDPLQPLLNPAIADLARWLVLPAAAGLRRHLVLPAAAAERLRDVVSFEIDRQTPFPLDAVAFDARIVGRRDDGQLDVELVAVPRAALQPRLDALGPVAGTLAGVDLADSVGVPLGVNLLPPAQRRRASDPWRTWNWVLAAVAVLMLALGLWQVLENRRDAADSFQRAVDARSGEARRAAAQRQLLLETVAGQAFLDQRRSGRPTAIEIMDELSRRLPDNTYLEKVGIENDRLTLIGLSSEASALVGRLEGSKLWRAPALTGALQPDPATNRDRFTLTAELAVVAPPAQPARQEARDAAAAR